MHHNWCKKAGIPHEESPATRTGLFTSKCKFAGNLYPRFDRKRITLSIPEK